MFYGWRVVAALFTILTFTSGLGFYNHAILLQALAADGRFPVETGSVAVSLFFLIGGITGLGVAPLLERLDARLIIVSGGVVASAALFTLGHVTETWQLYLVYAFFGAGFSASGLIPSTTLVARWFVAQRARALSVASTGLSVGGVVVTPFSAVLVTESSLSFATGVMALVYLVGVVPAALIAVRNSPASLGLQPDGRPVVDSAVEMPGIAIRDAVSHPFFWTLSVAYIFVMSAQVGGIAHQFGLLSERLTAAEASFAVALLPLFSIVGRLAGGVLLERVPILGFTLVMMLVQGTSLLSLALLSSPLGLYLALSLFGVTVGNLLMLQPLIVADSYGLMHYARIYAWSNLVTQVGVAMGPALLGTLFALSGGYQLPYLVAAGLGFFACMVFIIAKPPGMGGERQ